jgi:hypothetical protein
MIEELKAMQNHRLSLLNERLEDKENFYNKEFIKGQILELELQMQLLHLSTYEQETK